MHQILCIALICLTALTACGQAVNASAKSPTSSQGGNARAATTAGGRWSEWSAETRLQYVEAYVVGHQRGFYEACEVALKANLPDTAARQRSVQDCQGKNPRYSKYMDDYAGLITSYYRTYPEDLNLDLSELLGAFSDSEHLSIRQVHQYYGRSVKKIPQE